MAKSTMVNFRARPESLSVIDQAADAAGMSRSEWLRNAVELALANFRDKGFTPVASPIEIKSGAQCIQGNPRGCTAADWRQLPTGVKACATCGVRT